MKDYIHYICMDKEDQIGLEDYITTHTLGRLFTGLKNKGFKPNRALMSIEKPSILQQQSRADIKSLGNQQTDMYNDRRKQVNEDKQYPYSAINKIKYKYKGQENYKLGTGTLIQDKIVLTCAHNLYDFENKKEIKEIKYYFNQEEQYECSSIHYPAQYKQKGSCEYDYGILVLKDQIGKKYGYLGIDFSADYFGFCEIPGYPSTIYINGNQVENSEMRLYTANGVYNTISRQKLLSYRIPTSPGQSGSPIIKKQYDRELFSIGIHTQGGQGNINKGVLLTEAIMNHINQWTGKKVQKLNLGKKYLADQQLQGITKRKANTLQQIYEIDLGCNLITSIGLSHLLFLPLENLVILKLSNSQISKIPLFIHQNLKNLKNLDLSQNRITAEGSQQIAKLMNLKTLNLHHNQLRSRGTQKIATGNLQSLQNLNLSYNQIKNEGLRYLACGNLLKLSTLFAQLNEIDDQGTFCIAEGIGLTKLTNLHLKMNRISKKGADSLVFSKNLPVLSSISLYLEKNNITDSQLKEIRKSLSNRKEADVDFV